MSLTLPPNAVVEHFDLDGAQRALALLEPEQGDWPNPASLSRFDRDHMDGKQLRRFLDKVQVVDLGWVDDLTGLKSDCWMWTGGTHDKGYGRFYLGRDPQTDAKIWAYAHRIAYEHWVGFPPPGYIVDHRCNTKICCNPFGHLKPETNAENLRLADERRPWKRRNQYSKE